MSMFPVPNTIQLLFVDEVKLDLDISFGSTEKIYVGKLNT
jgi:hypothetical protein